MRFSEIHPFLRYARSLSPAGGGRLLVPYDCRLFYLVAGSCTLFSDDFEYTLSAGDALFIHSGVAYRFASAAAGSRMLAFNFDLSFRNADLRIPIPPAEAADYRASHAVEDIVLSDTALFSRVTLFCGMQEEEIHLVRAMREYQNNFLYASGASSAALAAFLFEGARRLPARENPRTSDVADEILLYLHEHYGEPVTNLSLAERFHYHPNYIGSLVRQKTGESLHRYLLNLRISRAVALLETTGLSVTEIASRVGFCDSSYFANYFKKVTGRTPRDYRQR